LAASEFALHKSLSFAELALRQQQLELQKALGTGQLDLSWANLKVDTADKAVELGGKYDKDVMNAYTDLVAPIVDM